MTTVLVKIGMDADEQSGFLEHLRLRKWCYENVDSDWRSMFLDRPNDTMYRHAAFSFVSPNEAMKFKLYAG